MLLLESQIYYNRVDSTPLGARRNYVGLCNGTRQQLPLVACVMREIINVQVGQCGNQIGYKVL